jgi:hypothetical protein
MGGQFVSAPACYGSFLGSNPDISQKYEKNERNKQRNGQHYLARQKIHKKCSSRANANELMKNIYREMGGYRVRCQCAYLLWQLYSPGSTPDISQKHEMGDISKGVANTKNIQKRF